MMTSTIIIATTILVTLVTKGINESPKGVLVPVKVKHRK